MFPYCGCHSHQQPALRVCESYQEGKEEAEYVQLAVHGMPAGTGKKGSRAPRKRAKSESIEERVERFPVVPKSQSVSAAVPLSITIDSAPTIQQACAASSVSHSLFSTSYPHPNPSASLHSPYGPYPAHSPPFIAPFSPIFPSPVVQFGINTMSLGE